MHCFVMMLLWCQIYPFLSDILLLRNPILNLKDFCMFNVGFFSFVELPIHLQKKLSLLIRFYISCCTASSIKTPYKGCV